VPPHEAAPDGRPPGSPLAFPKTHLRRRPAQTEALYPKYFGLSEASFSITPDPQYLFLSEQHKEALAHLLYGAGEGGGFVLLTGEVGTGKTTVCRAFLEQLPPEVDVALILNPAVSSIELLRAICDEFRIQVPEQERTSKQLVDRINNFLLQAHANGRRPVLMIDEAQNLRPKVLEQIRLLTNLETPKHKLLQIFLVGQPELRNLLGRQGLRQLDQRITARFHLKPLSSRETGDYIRHRLAVGGVERPLFTPSAVRRIHALSGGIPRLINILCDRALLGAYVSRCAHVTPRIVDKSAHEVKGEAALPPRPQGLGKVVIAAGLVVALAGGWWIRGWLETGSGPGIGELVAHWLPQGPAETGDHRAGRPAAMPETQEEIAEGKSRPETASAADGEPALLPAPGPEIANADPEKLVPIVPAQEAIPEPAATLVQAAVQPPAPPEAGQPAPDPGSTPAASPTEQTSQTVPSDPGGPAVEVIATPPAPAGPSVTPIATPMATSVPMAPVEPRSLALSESDAMRQLLTLWGLNLKELGPGAPCDQLPAYGLRCERDRGTWRQLYALNRPALLRLRPQAGEGREARYLVLAGLDAETVTLAHPNSSHQLPRAELKNLLSGSYTLVWQPPPVGTGIISAGSSGEPVRWLRKLLSKVPELKVTDTESGSFDAAVGAALRRFQVKYGLNPDGIAGPKTLIQLNNAVGMPGIPKLSKGS
jgi:general secretion pathway protein A